MNGWWLEAACRGKPTSWWFPPRGDLFTMSVARMVCSTCPVKGPCLEAALAEELVAGVQPTGIRGGVSAVERLRMLPALRHRPSPPESVPVDVVPTGRQTWPRRAYATAL